jgi:hypothetical protein
VIDESSRPDAVRAVYGWRAGSRWVFLAVVVAATSIAVPLLFSPVVTEPFSPGVVLWAALAIGWMAIVALVLWRVALTVELTGTALRFRTALSRGAIALSDVRTIRPVPVLAVVGVHAIVDTPMWMLVSRGFTDLIRDIEELRGSVDVRLSMAIGNADRMPGRNQYRRQS